MEATITMILAETQGLTLAGQVLYSLSHSATPIFINIIASNSSESPQTSMQKAVTYSFVEI
jgi:hypothetical protein